MTTELKMRMPAGAAEVLRECKVPRIRELLAFILDSVYSKRKHYLPMSSILMRDFVTTREYGSFLRWADKLLPWLERDHSYVSKELESPLRPAKCKAWCFVLSEIPDASCQNINGSSPAWDTVPVPILSLVRLAAIRERLGVDSDLAAVIESSMAFDGAVNVGLSNEVIQGLELDGTTEGIERVNHDQWKVGFDGGGRVYTPVVQLKKDIRRKCLRFDTEMVNDEGDVFELSEGAAEVDAACCHYFFVACSFSPPDERDDILDLIAAGRFYESFADEDLPRSEAKIQLLSALFQYRCQLPGWKRFARAFPKTAKRIMRIRDKEKVIRRRFFRGRTIDTRYGQREMSRILTRMESKVFNRAISRMWIEQGIPAVRIHDAVLVRASNVQIADLYVREAFKYVTGREAILESKVYG